MSVVWDAAALVAKFRFPGLLYAALRDGNYLATLSTSGITNATGQPLAGDHDFDFFVFAGDVAGNPDPDRRDRAINLTDFDVVAAHFGQSGMTYFDENLNSDGSVNLGDFNILAGKFGTTLDEVAGPGEISVTATSSSTMALQGFGKDIEGEVGWRIQMSTNVQDFFFLTNLPENADTFRVRAFGNGQDTAYTPKQAATMSLPPPQVTSFAPIGSSQLLIDFSDNSGGTKRGHY